MGGDDDKSSCHLQHAGVYCRDLSSRLLSCVTFLRDISSAARTGGEGELQEASRLVPAFSDLPRLINKQALSTHQIIT